MDQLIVNRIGLPVEQTEQLAAGLNELLANYQVFYMNVRGFHWNIRGENFFELHLKFEELYNDLLLKIDEVAERILTLGFRPLHAYSDYLAKAELHEVKDLSEGRACVEAIVEALQLLVAKQRKLLEQSEEAGDEATNSLMSDYVREQEKLLWMYSAYLG